jgi:glyoxylase-like metal-dependent hydrolase (beta-lactamase superfamily II)
MRWAQASPAAAQAASLSFAMREGYARLAHVDAHPGDIIQIDSLLAGIPGMTGVHLVRAEAPALIDTGAQTSAATVRAAIHAAGIGPHDLAWLVLTHIHLDHCGAVGDLARAFPNATVVVHPRGARHLVEPDRLVAGTHALFGRLASGMGGLTAVPEERIVVAPDSHVIPLGGGRTLRAVWSPGHARHHMSLLEEGDGILFAGDAVGVQMGGGALYPSIPPPEYDVDAALGSLDVLEGLRPTRLYVSHFGGVEDPAEAIDSGRRAQSALGQAARRAHAAAPGDVPALAAAVEDAWPSGPALGSPEALLRWHAFGWYDNNLLGLQGMAEREARDA